MPPDVGPRIDALLHEHVLATAAAPAAALAWARRDECGDWHLALGAAGCATDALFDLASVTKPLTALAAMQLVAEGVLAPSTTVAAVMPELVHSAAAGARLDDLLAHRAGLPSWGALYRRDPWGATTAASLPPDVDDEADARGRMLKLAASRLEPVETGFSAPAVYSDLGYVLAGEIVARASGGPLVERWERLGAATSAARLRRRLGEDFDRRVLPTEHVPWRGGDVRGVVHDENAHLLERASGNPGHAGAFGTAEDVARVAMRFVDALSSSSDAASILPRALAEEMIAPRPAGSHLLGWDGVTRGASSSGTRFGARSFGHLGFTGTSVWADPDAGAVAVLLTNRTYPSRDNLGIRTARPRVHDALWELDPRR